MGNLLWALEFLQQYENFFGICSPVCGSSAWWLYGGANGDLLQEDLCHMLCFPGLLKPAPLSPRQTTADPCLHMRHSDIQRQVWLSPCGISGPWCAQGFIGALQASLVGMGLDSKHDFAPPTILLGLLLCLWTWGIFFWWDPTFTCQWLFSSKLQFWSSHRR